MNREKSITSATLLWVLVTACTPVTDEEPPVDAGLPVVETSIVIDELPPSETEVVVPDPAVFLSTELVINEIMASPEEGEPDWVELLVTGDTAINLRRFTLVDGNGDHVPVALPNVTLSPGEFYVIPATREPPDDGEFYLDFQLGRDDRLTLESNGVTVDTLSWEEGDLPEWASFGRLPDGEDRLVALSPTPGEPNIEYEAITCDPIADIDDVNYVEGDIITINFSCLTGEPISLFELDLGEIPLGVELDEESGTLTWTTGLDQAGRYDFHLNVYSPSPVSLPVEAASVTIWIADAVNDPENIPVDPRFYQEEWGLPVFHLEPSGRLSQTYTSATVTFLGREYEAEMKIRGAVSVGFPKNSFTLRFGDEDLDTGDLGLGDEDHIVLISTFDDNSYVRQKLAYDLWAAMADFWGEDRLTPRTFFAVVYLSGNYHGLYVAIDRIDDHFAREMGLSRDGNLYKSVNHDANFSRLNARGEPKRTLHDGYEKKEGDPPAGEEGAWDDLDSLVAFVADSDDETFVTNADDWIRVDEFMDWFLFVHYTVAADSAGKNAYLYNDPEDFEFRYIPWDLNHSFGQSWRTSHISPEDPANYRGRNGIFNHFLNHPETAAELWDRREVMIRFGPLNPAWFRDQLDAYYELIEPSASRDWERWGSAHQAYFRAWHDPPHSFEDEREILYEWLEERARWMEGRTSF